MMDPTTEIFKSFQDYLNADHDLREEIRNVVRELEQTTREVQTILQAIHQPANTSRLKEICDQTEPIFAKVREKYSQLDSKVPDGQYYRFSDHWRFATQRLVFLSALTVYLKEERLASREETAQTLGVKTKREEGFHIDLDDYLMGVLTMTSELSRLAMNAVTAGDYTRPIKVSRFIGELDSGFRLLNLKNDSLRKRFDGLKYDVKRCEEVVYDLTIRGLVGREEKTE